MNFLLLNEKIEKMISNGEAKKEKDENWDFHSDENTENNVFWGTLRQKNNFELQPNPWKSKKGKKMAKISSKKMKEAKKWRKW